MALGSGHDRDAASPPPDADVRSVGASDVTVRKDEWLCLRRRASETIRVQGEEPPSNKGATMYIGGGLVVLILIIILIVVLMRRR
jgi:hypothetical protein